MSDTLYILCSYLCSCSCSWVCHIDIHVHADVNVDNMNMYIFTYCGQFHTHVHVCTLYMFLFMFMSMCMHKVWSESTAQGEIISIWIIFQTRLFQDFFRPIPSQFGPTFCSGPSTTKRRRQTRFCCWFEQPPLISSWGCSGTARGQPAPDFTSVPYDPLQP
jgi:hypothetical protein